MTSSPAGRMALSRSPAALAAVAAVMLSGVAGASYLAGRSNGTAPTEPAATAPVIARTTPSAAPATVPVACTQCGVVESVQAVQRKGGGTGVGAVAGGVVGGVLGHQVGAGQGRTAMTVLGALGGGYAGNEVEKRARAVTVYRVRVRTDQGELRTVEQAHAPAVGQRVRLDGNTLRALPPATGKG